jgi:hypothetical protein
VTKIESNAIQNGSLHTVLDAEMSLGDQDAQDPKTYKATVTLESVNKFFVGNQTRLVGYRLSDLRIHISMAPTCL